MQLLRFHLVEDESCEKEIKQGLEKKLDRMVIHICNRKQGFIRRSIFVCFNRFNGIAADMESYRK